MSVDRWYEQDMVERFCQVFGEEGLMCATGTDPLPGFVVGAEVALEGAGPSGSNGAADLLAVTADGRWWLVEAKLSRNPESHPSQLFGSQLARYARSVEVMGVERLHSRLEGYLFGRRAGVAPPGRLAPGLLETRDLADALRVWCAARGVSDPIAEAGRLVRGLRDQLERRTLTLAALVDVPDEALREWVRRFGADRSLAVLTMRDSRAVLDTDGLHPLDSTCDGLPLTLPPFQNIPQSYKPTPATLPLLLSEKAIDLYRQVVWSRFKVWTADRWPEVKPSKVTAATFSVDFQGQGGREVCLQIGRARFAQDEAVAGEHPLRLGVNLIWAAEQVRELWNEDPEAGGLSYADLEHLTERLLSEAGMLVRGIPRTLPVHGAPWRERLRVKMRGDENRRAELVLAREVGDREGFGWPDVDPASDRELLDHCLDAVETWLGPPPYATIDRRITRRAVPGTVR